MVFVFIAGGGKNTDKFLKILGFKSNTYGLTERKENQKLNDYVKEQLENCSSLTENVSSCFRRLMQLLLDETQVFQIQDSLVKVQEGMECHASNHFLGRELYKKKGELAGSFSQCTNLCLNGCFHGIVEGYFEEKKLFSSLVSQEIVKKDILSICDKKDPSKPYIYTECNHGIGHALMILTDMDLPRSLSFCDSLKRTGDDREQKCYSGAFMENFASAINPDHKTKYTKSDDLFYPCNILDDRYLTECYGYLALYFIDMTDTNWEEVIRLCNQVPNKYRWICFSQLGENIVGTIEENQLRSKTCDLVVDEEYRRECVKGGVMALGGRYIEDAIPMNEFCESVSEKDKSICYQQMGRSIFNWGYNQQEKDIVCKEVADLKYQEYCLSRVVGV